MPPAMSSAERLAALKAKVEAYEDEYRHATEAFKAVPPGWVGPSKEAPAALDRYAEVVERLVDAYREYTRELELAKR